MNRAEDFAPAVEVATLGDSGGLAQLVACMGLSAGAGCRQKSFPLEEVPMTRQRLPAFVAMVFLAGGLGAVRADAQELPNLPPITAEELALKDNPAGVPRGREEARQH